MTGDDEKATTQPERLPQEDEPRIELPGSGTGQRDDDETISAEDLITLTDEPKPAEPSD